MLKRRIPVQTLLFYGLTAVKLASPLAITPLLAHRLPAGELGVWSVCMSIAATAAVFLELGFGLSATRAIADPESPGPRAVFEAVCSTRAVAALLVLPAVALAVFLLVHDVPAELPVAVLCTWLTALSMGWTSLWYFQSQHRLALSAALDAVGIAVGVLLVWFGAHGLRSALMLNIATYAVPSLIGHAWVSRSLGRARLSLASARAGWRLTRALAKFRFVATTYTTAIPFLLSLALAPARIAPFFVAERVTRALAAMMIPFVQLLYPRMCTLRHVDAAAHRRRSALLAAGLGGAACAVALAVFAAAPLIAGVFAPPAIAVEVAGHLRELVLFLVPLAVSSVLGNLYMLPAGLDTAFNRIVLAAAAVGITLAVLLPRSALGASGASVAIVASELTAAVLMAASFFAARRR